ncbi:MAG: transcription elongation factor GreA [Ruminococcaceae bacterium]|nr:transcription elongation factor GreA [Oscillospiraceae bacterium]
MAKESKQILVTEEGLANLEKELEYLKSVKRAEIADRLKEARSFGDLSENSEYDEAKNEQAINESRIAELEQQLKNARVLDESQLSGNLVHVGLEVVIENVATKETRTYRIVGVTEADPMSGKISDESPIGHALLGHAVNDVVEVVLPTGKIVNYRLVSIAK